MDFAHKIFRQGVNIPSLRNKKIVFTNGCFDLLHPGHLHYLLKAKSYGDILIIGLNSDSSVKINKGINRPINKFDFRASMLSYFDFVDFVVEFNEETPIELIKKLCPNILVKGGDYSETEIVGADFVKSTGGEVIVIDFLDGFSSTNLINSILLK